MALTQAETAGITLLEPEQRQEIQREQVKSASLPILSVPTGRRSTEIFSLHEPVFHEWLQHSEDLGHLCSLGPAVASRKIDMENCGVDTRTFFACVPAGVFIFPQPLKIFRTSLVTTTCVSGFSPWLFWPAAYNTTKEYRILTEISTRAIRWQGKKVVNVHQHPIFVRSGLLTEQTLGQRPA
ncbi:MAG: hypothetical protein ACK5PS_02330 [Desulfopila sp.]